MILDGKIFAEKKKQQIIRILTDKNLTPGLATILVGSDGASYTYVAAKIRACRQVGFYSHPVFLDEKVSEAELLECIMRLNLNPQIHGILVQLPLPDHIAEKNILSAILPEKDVDCFHPSNLGSFFAGVSDFSPCTPKGILSLLKSLNIPLESHNALVIGKSNIVGKPTAFLLLQQDMTVSIAHKKTKNLKHLCREADIIVSAAGSPNLITADMIKEGVIVIDAGINRVPDPDSPKKYRIQGDADFQGIAAKCKAITPVPGGVGPMTIASLLENTLYLAEQSLQS